jgi:hypothetical protein
MYQISDVKLWESVNARCGSNLSGCYELFVGDAQSNRLPIQRLLGVDHSGLLYIGASKAIPNRIADLKKGIWAAYGRGKYKNPWSHGLGMKLPEAFKVQFPFESIQLAIYPCELTEGSGTRVHYEEEARRLNEYTAQFGELPPLNGWRGHRLTAVPLQVSESRLILSGAKPSCEFVADLD